MNRGLEMQGYTGSGQVALWETQDFCSSELHYSIFQFTNTTGTRLVSQAQDTLKLLSSLL